jgi:hypothetical protein
VENSLWKRLWTCRKADNVMNLSVRVTLKQSADISIEMLTDM